MNRSHWPRRAFCGHLLSATTFALTASPVWSQDGKTPEDEPSETDVNAKHPVRICIDASIDKYQYIMADRPDEKPTYKAIQRWTNVSRDPFGEGVLVVWFDRGLPLCTTHIYPWLDALHHECISVSRDRFVVAEATGLERWRPKSSGAEFVKIAGEIPAERPVERTRQMKGLAARFAATLLGWNPDNSDREELRMLDKPLHRYTDLRPDRPHGVIDGAIFGFVQGTDPEVLLLLEATENAKGERAWQYAAVRATSGELQAKFDGKVVWHAEKITGNATKESSRMTLQSPLPAEVLAARKANK